MDKKKSACLVIMAFLIVSIVAVANVLKVSSTGSTVMHSATVYMPPTSGTLPNFELDFNVTSTGTLSINKTSILLPSNVNYTGIVAPVNATSGWTWAYNSPTNSLNFTANATYAIGESSNPTNPYAWFNVSMQWLNVPTGQVGFGVDCYQNSSASLNNTKWLYVGFSPQFSASMTPSLVVRNSTSYLFNITATNTGSSIGINKINITYPSGYTFNVLTGYSPGTWVTGQDSSRNTFYFSGANLLVGTAAWIQVNMTSSSTEQLPGHWNLTAWDSGGTWLGTYDLPLSVDKTPPSVTVIAPTQTYLSGNIIWINGSINDNVNATPSVAISDTTHFPLNPQIGPTYNASAPSYTWYFSYYNTSAVPDGYLALNLTGTDAVGNVMLTPTSASTTVDNTAPTLISLVVKDDKIGNLTAVGSTFYMSANAVGLNFTVTFAEAHTSTNVTYISNGTGTTAIPFSNNTWFYNAAPWYNVTGVNTVTINNITITDAAQPNNNTLVTGSYTIIRDLIPPTVPTFTVTPICGGLVIKNLSSTDNVGVLDYQIYVNGTSFVNATVTQLANTTLASVAGALNTSYAFNGALVLNLTNYAGNYANLTIRAVDVGGNIGNFSIPTVYTIPQGQWCPIELQPNWNLVGLPLIPANTSRAAVLSLILKQGASGVIVYGYNSATNTFTLNPATMTDGNAYWIYMTAYDVIIVNGLTSTPPPALPPNYNLVVGWNLAGYKSTTTHNVTSYLASLPSGSYFTYIYVWDPSAQTWLMKSGSDMLSPGQGFWIYMYSNQTLIPPIP
jgi:hypothetical protein